VIAPAALLVCLRGMRLASPAAQQQQQEAHGMCVEASHEEAGSSRQRSSRKQHAGPEEARCLSVSCHVSDHVLSLSRIRAESGRRGLQDSIERPCRVRRQGKAGPGTRQQQGHRRAGTTTQIQQRIFRQCFNR
jgi:hypothetical protein